MTSAQIAPNERGASRLGPDPRVASKGMPRKPTGEVVERRRGVAVIYALRFRAYGRRRY